MLTDDISREIDLTIDGADEVDPALDLIKGGGSALLCEKIVAQASRREVIVVGAGKLSPRLGTHWRLPVTAPTGATSSSIAASAPSPSPACWTRAGVAGHGLFFGIAPNVIVVGGAGLRHLQRGVEAARADESRIVSE